MKIEKSRVVITEIPGFDSIAVEPNGDSTYGVHIVFTSDLIGLHDWSFDLDELTELRDALNVAINEARLMSRLSITVNEGPWTTVDDIPASVFSVLDRQGDVWTIDSETGEWRLGDSSVSPGGYGPFTRA